MKHHNKHFIGALSVIVFVMILIGVLLSTQNLTGFDVTGMTAEATTYPALESGATMIVEYQDNNTNVVETYRLSFKNGNYIVEKKNNGNNYDIVFQNTDIFTVSKNMLPPQNYETIDISIIPPDGNQKNVIEKSLVKDKNMDINSIILDELEIFFENPSSQMQRAIINPDVIALSQKLGISTNAIVNEHMAINDHLHKEGSSYTQVFYDVLTDTYSGKIGDNYVEWDKEGETMYVVTDNTDGTRSRVYKEKKKGDIRYYQEICNVKGECTDAKVLSGNAEKEAEEEYEKAEEAYKEVEDNVESAMKAGEIKDIDGTSITSTVRQESYMNDVYNELEAQVVGKLTGYLNNWINKRLSGWSKGVPAGICKYVFGLEYYKNSGWMAMPGNTSTAMLQSTIISHSNTIIIEGEKEEITENLYRYAYSLRLLANQSVEWTTYLYNSCSGENSEEQFYDYGALGAAEYYAFHYAGAGSQDMIFDCTIEQCLYDQACVVLSDGSAPVCVSLVNGAGFSTPDAGSEYDCAIW